ncbi:MAG: GNAT family N-acetyltransferase [Oscillospiraceae bacterium]|nr:GNAT family N-acetyltransferase [Oscillospiraceae bacterium]
MNADISHATLADLDDLVALNEEALFYGKGVRPHFERVLASPDNIALKCTVGGMFAGALVYVKGIALPGCPPELAARIGRLSEGRTVYTGDTVAVKREYRRLGLAGRLCAAMIAELRRRGAELALNEFWIYPDGSAPARKVFAAFDGGIRLGRYENFYRDLHAMGFHCPVCGEACVCAAEIYLAEIPEVGDEND